MAARARGVRRLVRIEVRAGDIAVAERAAAEAWEAGIVGLEERDALGGVVLLILYAPAASGDIVRNWPTCENRARLSRTLIWWASSIARRFTSQMSPNSKGWRCSSSPSSATAQSASYRWHS